MCFIFIRQLQKIKPINETVYLWVFAEQCSTADIKKMILPVFLCTLACTHTQNKCIFLFVICICHMYLSYVYSGHMSVYDHESESLLTQSFFKGWTTFFLVTVDNRRGKHLSKVELLKTVLILWRWWNDFPVAGLLF